MSFNPQLPPVAKTKDELLFAAIRPARAASSALSGASNEMFRLIESGKIKDDDAENLHDHLLRQYSDASAVPLFIAASNLGLDMPEDLCAPLEECDGCGAVINDGDPYHVSEDGLVLCGACA
jgi:hypothetical protein